MKSKVSSRKIIARDGIEVYYWIVSKNGMNKKNVKVLHPASSMNHTALEPLEKLLNNEDHTTLTLDPRGVGYSVVPCFKEYFSLERYSDDLKRILEKEGIENPDYIGHSMGFMPIVDYVSKTGNASRIFGIGASYHFPDTTASKPLFHIFNRVLRYNEILGSIITRLKHDRPYND